MNPSFGRGRGRRPVLQLGDASTNSRYLARYGYQNKSEESASNGQKEKSNQESVGLSRLVGAYDDSESDEEESVSTQSNVPSPVPTVLPENTNNSTAGRQGEAPEMDFEVATFLAEINAISTDSPEHSDIPLPPGAFIPRDQTAEVLAEKYRLEVAPEEEAPLPPTHVEPSGRPPRKAKSYGMFVKGGSEQLGERKAKPYTSKFVKGGTELLGLKDQEREKNGMREEEIYQLPEVPTTVWQQCKDEKTQYVYYWNYRSDQVTWHMPGDYTQYLLLLQEYEEKLAHIPEDVQKRLEERRLSRQSENGSEAAPEERKPVPMGPQLPESKSQTSSPVPVSEPSLDSSSLNIQDIKAKCRLKKAKKMHGPDLPQGVSSVDAEKSTTDSGDGPNLSVSDVDMFVSDILSKNASVGGGSVQGEGRKDGDKVKRSRTEVEDFDIDDIDAALEMALERKTSTSKKGGKKHQRKDRDMKQDQHKTDLDPRSSSDTHLSRHKLESQSKRPRTDQVLTIKTEPDVQPKKARLVAAYDDDDSEEDTAMSVSSRPGSNEDDETKETVKRRPVPSLIKMKDEVEDAANIALGKLEFLEVTKKGLSKLQVLLLELQTRFRDWQDGGLDTEYFLCRLHEGKRQLELYEQSAVPLGYTCHWDRNFRRYFYTNETTGDSQWDYPDGVTPVTSATPGTDNSPVTTTTTTTTPGGTTDGAEVTSSREPALPEDSPPSPHPPPPPPEEEETSPVMYGPHLPSVEPVSESTSQGVENATNTIDGEPMAPDSSEETYPSDAAQKISESEASVVFPGEPPPPGTEVLLGLPPPPPPSDPYPRKGGDASYSEDDADMDVDDTPHSPEVNDVVSSSAQDYQHPAVPEMSSATSSDVLHHESAVEVAPVIFRAPQLNVMSSISSSSSSPVQPSVEAPPVITSQPVISDSAVPAVVAAVDMFAENDLGQEISSTSVVEPPQQSELPPPLPPPETEKVPKKEKKKKKSITSSSLSLKKKNVSSLVQKWQQVKVQVEEEEKVNEERQMAIRQQLEEWKQAHS